MPGIDFKAIAQRLTCEEFARHELCIKGNRAQCPFHGGHNYNLAFYRDGKCHCHKCGRTADVVQLAAAVWHVSQLDAARRLNDEFRLGIAAGGPDRAVMHVRRLEMALRDAQQQEREERWAEGCDAFLRAIDGFYAALADLHRYSESDMATADGTAALTRCLQAKSDLDSIWFHMTGNKPDKLTDMTYWGVIDDVG